MPLQSADLRCTAQQQRDKQIDLETDNDGKQLGPLVQPSVEYERKNLFISTKSNDG